MNRAYPLLGQIPARGGKVIFVTQRGRPFLVSVNRDVLKNVTVLWIVIEVQSLKP